MIRTFIDDLGLACTLSYPPQRIISLCPSITETLFDLGLEKNIVGRTKFCIHPQDKVLSIPSIGGTKQVHYEIIDDLKPDLILCQKEENTSDIVYELRKKHPVFVADVNQYKEALRMIDQIGHITGKSQEAQAIIQDIQLKMSNLQILHGTFLYFIWKNPWMVAGKNTYIDSILSLAGLTNSTSVSRYPSIELPSETQNINPDFIFLSSEPYPFQEKHIPEIQHHFPSTSIYCVDGEIFSWYGSRMRLICDYLNHLGKQIQSPKP